MSKNQNTTVATSEQAQANKKSAYSTGATIKRLLGYIFQYKVRVAVVVVSIIVGAIAQASSALFLQTLIDDYILPMVGVSNPDWGPLTNVLTLMACLYASGVFCTWLWGWIVVKIEQGTLKKIRDDMFAHQQYLPIRYFDQHEHGDIMSLYTNDTDALRQAISQSFPQMCASFVSVCAAFFALLWISIPLTMFILVFTAVLLVVMNKLVSRSGKFFVLQQKKLGDLNGFIEESINGTKVIKVFNHEAAITQTFDEKNEALCHASTNANMYGNVVMPVVMNLGYLQYVFLAILGGFIATFGMNDVSLSGVGPLTLGSIVSLLTLSRSFINPIGQISTQFNMVMMAVAGAGRIFELLDEQVESDNGTVQLVNVEYDETTHAMREVDYETGYWAWKREAGDDGKRSLRAAEKLKGHAREIALSAREQAITSADGRLTLLRGDVRFTDVTFGYVDDKPVLHDISWFAKPGQKMALVGATGAGKTTITNLINRFYDIQEGQILYDGIDVRNICKEDLRRSLGIVLQDVNLFTGTVMNNIRYGRLNATDEECIAAAKLTNAHDFIMMLPHGYDTVLEGDGSGLSQGQRQLISIARAAVADTPAMILDEATSSIDTRTEEVVQKGMDALMQGRTVFVIAHRLSTVRNSDVIMVLDHGRIIERGSHDELIEQKGEYYQLYTGAVELE